MPGIENKKLIVFMLVMVMSMMMLVSMRFAQFTPRPEIHPRRKRIDEKRRTDLQIRLDAFCVPLIPEMNRKRRENPDDERMRNRRRQPEQNRLRHRSPDGDDKCRHHRLRMPGFKTVQCAQQDAGRDEKPQVCGPGLQCMEKVVHSKGAYPHPPYQAMQLSMFVFSSFPSSIALQ
jgi:hypothetical protein